MNRTVTCPHCKEVVVVEDGHTCWRCPKCENFFNDHGQKMFYIVLPILGFFLVLLIMTYIFTLE